jgi:starch phosphorylase
MTTVSQPSTHDRIPEGRLHAVDPRAAGLRRIAYFSMEIALDPALPTYSGGLGVLAGDILRSAADLALPMVGVTLLYREGYFVQHLDRGGHQSESAESWDPRARLALVDKTVTVTIEGRTVKVRAWRYDLRGSTGAVVPVYLLDTDIEENDPQDRALAGSLYGGDVRYRLAQEIVLGYGGYALLDAMGLADSIGTFHMNEGHAALLVPAALEARASAGGAHDVSGEEISAARKRFVFTTHTPVPAGHDRFDVGLTRALLGDERTRLVQQLGALRDGTVNMTQLALRGSHYVNAVAMRHGEVSRLLFPGDVIHAITNGVHAQRWTAPAFAILFDRYVPEWRGDNGYLRHAIGIPLEDLCAAHRAAKDDLSNEIKRRTGTGLDTTRFTIGFARRAAEYKRGYLAFSDVDRLRAISQKVGPMQFVFAGKAHPRDAGGKHVIARIFEAAAQLEGAVRVVYLENYEMALAQRLVAGVDLWLNTPQPPLEASGTSGMKAALNGVPSLSTLDGWWVEGCIEGQTGWAIGDGTADVHGAAEDARDAEILYSKLEETIVPLFYGDPDVYARIMRNAIALNASYFNTHRTVEQYVRSAYFGGVVPEKRP